VRKGQDRVVSRECEHCILGVKDIGKYDESRGGWHQEIGEQQKLGKTLWDEKVLGADGPDEKEERREGHEGCLGE